MLTDIHVIRVLLARLVASRGPLFVFVEGSDERFHSMLLDVDHKLDALIADELHPQRGHQHMRVGTHLRMASRVDGVELRFRTRVRALDTDSAIAAYLLDFPLALDYREHRDLFRTRMSRTSRVAACLRNAAHQNLDARVMDISISGIRLAVPAPHPLRADDDWQCTVLLPNGAFDAPLSILRVREVSTRGAREDHVGARFGELSVPAGRRIGHFMADAQRDLLRSRRTTALGE